MIGLLTETIGSPTPMKIPFVRAKQLPDSSLHVPDRAADVALPAVGRLLGDRQQGGARLRLAQQENFLFNIYRMGKNAIERGSRDSWTPTPRRVLAAEAAVNGTDAHGVGRGRRGSAPARYARAVRDAVPRSGAARRARLHHARRPARLPRPRRSSSTRCSRPASPFTARPRRSPSAARTIRPARSW